MLFGQGIHRVAVVDDYDNLLHVVTQSTVIFFFTFFFFQKICFKNKTLQCRS